MYKLRKYCNYIEFYVIILSIIISHSIIILPSQTQTSLANLTNIQQITITPNTIFKKYALKYSQQQYQQNKTYSYNDVILQQPLPKIYLLNEIITIQGIVNQIRILNLISTGKLINKNYFNLYFVLTNIKTKIKKVYSQEVPIQNRKFKQQISFNTLGQYQFNIFVEQLYKKQSTVIKVVNQSQFMKQLKQIKKLSRPKIKPIGLNLQVEQNQFYVKWVPQSALTKINIYQKNLSKTFIVSNDKGQFKIPYHQFINFTEIQTTLSISHAQSAYISAYYQLTQFTKPLIKSFNITKHQFMQKDNNIIQQGSFKLKNMIKSGNQFKIQAFCKQEIMRNVIIKGPNYQINQIFLNVSNYDNDKDKDKGQILPAYKKFMINFVGQSEGVYILQINHKLGFAVLNIPIYVGNYYPLLPDKIDLEQNDSKNQSFIQQSEIISMDEILVDINSIRQLFNRSSVVLNSKLSQVAKKHSNDMILRNFVSHTNPNNQTAKMRVEKAGIYSNSCGQNIIVEKSYKLLQQKLNRSPLHLKNTVDPDWTRVGIGLIKSEKGDYYLTQVFCNEEINANDQYLQEVKKKVIAIFKNKTQQNPQQNIKFSKQLNKWLSKNSLQNPKGLNQILAQFSIKTGSLIKINLPAASNYQEQMYKKQNIKKIGKNKFGMAVKYQKGVFKIIGFFY